MLDDIFRIFFPRIILNSRLAFPQQILLEFLQKCLRNSHNSLIKHVSKYFEDCNSKCTKDCSRNSTKYFFRKYTKHSVFFDFSRICTELLQNYFRISNISSNIPRRIFQKLLPSFYKNSFKASFKYSSKDFFGIFLFIYSIKDSWAISMGCSGDGSGNSSKYFLRILKIPSAISQEN